jgi:hypothetical protein
VVGSDAVVAMDEQALLRRLLDAQGTAPAAAAAAGSPRIPVRPDPEPASEPPAAGSPAAPPKAAVQARDTQSPPAAAGRASLSGRRPDAPEKPEKKEARGCRVAGVCGRG